MLYISKPVEALANFSDDKGTNKHYTGKYYTKFYTFNIKLAYHTCAVDVVSLSLTVLSVPDNSEQPDNTLHSVQAICTVIGKPMPP